MSRWDVEKTATYIKNQKQHHAENELMPEFEDTLEEIESTNSSA